MCLPRNHLLKGGLWEGLEDILHVDNLFLMVARNCSVQIFWSSQTVRQSNAHMQSSKTENVLLGFEIVAR